MAGAAISWQALPCVRYVTRVGLRVALIITALASGLLLGCGALPWVCTPSSCAKGCCTADGVCVEGGANLYTGTGGEACQMACRRDNCGSGCCQYDAYLDVNACIPPSRQSIWACGTDATQCAPCPSMMSCIGGRCCYANAARECL